MENNTLSPIKAKTKTTQYRYNKKHASSHGEYHYTAKSHYHISKKMLTLTSLTLLKLKVRQQHWAQRGKEGRVPRPGKVGECSKTTGKEVRRVQMGVKM